MKIRRIIALITAIMSLSVVALPALAAEVENEPAVVQYLGDVNGDSTVNTGDATYILKHCSGLRVLTVEETAFADANNDGAINTSDATYILKVSAGLEDAIILDNTQAYTVSYSVEIPEGIEYTLPESESVKAGDVYVIKKEATAKTNTLRFAGWLLKDDDSAAWHNYTVGQSFVMPEHDVELKANFVTVTPVDPTDTPTDIPTNVPTGDPTDTPTNAPTSNPTNAPTGEPTSNPTSNPTNNPTSNPTNNPTSAPTDTPTEEPTGPVHLTVIHYLPGSNSENGGGVKNDGYMKDTQEIAGEYGIIDKTNIPHSVTLNAGNTNAYAFTHWVDEEGNVYYPGDKIFVGDKDEMTLTAKWESGYTVVMNNADIENYVFDMMDNKVIVGGDMALYYYNTAYFFPIGFDSDSPYQHIQYHGSFTGKFEGAGYTISNLTVEYGGSDICSAFIYINEGSVTNFNLKINQIYSKADLIAGVACTNVGVIRNVNITWDNRNNYYYSNDLNAEITSFDIDRCAKVGGVAAYNRGTIANCDVNGIRLKVCQGYCGGICGYNAASGVVKNCTARNIKITFIYDPENYKLTGNEIAAIVPMNLNSNPDAVADNEVTGYTFAYSNSFAEGSNSGEYVDNPRRGVKRRDDWQ